MKGYYTAQGVSRSEEGVDGRKVLGQDVGYNEAA